MSISLCAVLLVTLAACSVSRLPVVTIATVETEAVAVGVPLEFVLQVDRAPVHDLMISVAVASECPLPAPPQTVTIDAEELQATLTVQTTGVSVGDAGCTVTVTIVAGEGYRVGDDAETAATAEIIAGPSYPVVMIEAAHASVTTGTEVSFTLTATPMPASPITVNVSWDDPDSALSEPTPTMVAIPTSGTAELSAPTNEAGPVTVTVEIGSNYLVGSPASATVTVGMTDTVVMTGPSDPGAPPGPSLTAPNHCSLQVSWTEPSGPVTDYDVQYSSDSGANWTPSPHRGTRRSTVIKDLNPSTTYLVQIRANDGAEMGPWSESASKRTKPTPTRSPAAGVLPQRTPITEGEWASFSVLAEYPLCTDLAVSLLTTRRNHEGTVIFLHERSIEIRKGTEMTSFNAYLTIDDTHDEPAEAGRAIAEVQAGDGYRIDDSRSVAEVYIEDNDG